MFAFFYLLQNIFNLNTNINVCANKKVIIIYIVN